MFHRPILGAVIGIVLIASPWLAYVVYLIERGT